MIVLLKRQKINLKSHLKHETPPHRPVFSAEGNFSSRLAPSAPLSTKHSIRQTEESTVKVLSKRDKRLNQLDSFIAFERFMFGLELEERRRKIVLSAWDAANVGNKTAALIVNSRTIGSPAEMEKAHCGLIKR